jgi:hypothetical protein
MKIHFISGLCLIFLLCSCGSGSNPPETAPNPIDQFSEAALAYMANSTPKGSDSSLLLLSNINTKSFQALLSSATFTEPKLDFKRPGNGGSPDVSVSQYVTDILNPSYTDGNPEFPMAPTVFFRFLQELDILKIIGSQVPFLNGAPIVGTHSVKADIAEDPQDNPVTFDVVVTALSGNDRFDVLIETPFGWRGAFRNRGGIANIVGYEEKDGGTHFSYTRFFWNQNTGKLAYDWVSTADTLYEVNRLSVAETNGLTKILHIFENTRLYIEAPNGGNSANFDVSIDFAGTPTFMHNFCASGSANSAVDDVCGGAGDNKSIGFVDGIKDESSTGAATLKTEVFGDGADEFADVTEPNVANFLSTLVN